MNPALPMKSLLAASLWPLAKASDQLGQRWRRLWAFARLSASLPDIDASVVVLGMPELHGSRRIQLGRGLYLYRELYLETQAEGSIELGDEVVLSRGVHIVSHARVSIGRGSMVGEYVSIRDANHRRDLSQPLRHAGHQAAPVTIGSQVWIGRGAIILPGVSIGHRAVIGANSVVTHDVPAGAVVAGAPARALKRSAS